MRYELQACAGIQVNAASRRVALHAWPRTAASLGSGAKDQESVTDVTVLAIAECPGAALLEERLAVAAAGLPGIRVSYRVIASEAEATAAGMSGSPTLLADGTDPFAIPGQEPALACRLYRQDNGALAPAPSVGQLRRVLTRAGRR
jgi:hypothetical protein